MSVIAAALDRELNAHGYILPDSATPAIDCSARVERAICIGKRSLVADLMREYHAARFFI